MTISSVSSTSVAYTPAVQTPRAEAGEVQRAGRDATNDGDADNLGAAPVQKPTLNLEGQTVGSRINVTA